MDPKQSPSTPKISPNIAEELAHASQEMYKKNFELAERNKTLALLRKIDEIILSSVTETEEIAHQVVNVVTAETSFKRTVILLIDKVNNVLVRTAVSQTQEALQAELETKKIFKGSQIPMTCDENIIVQCIKERQVKITHDFAQTLIPNFTKEESEKIQEIFNIKSTLVYPLIVRNGVIGAMTISIGEDESLMSQYEKDLIDRLADVIGIALDNSLLYQRIQEANEKLKALDILKDEFVSLASHELRTPMTAIKSYLWMVLENNEGELNEKQKLHLQRAYVSTDRLIKLVNDMLNVSRIESGRITLDIKNVNLQTIIQDVIGEISPRAQELGIHLIFTPNTILPNVMADSDKLKEVLINLIGNSLKFTPRDGSITISSTLSGGMVVTSVKDTGKGIKQEDIPKLFKKFAVINADYLRRQNAQGTGLGLYISKSIIELFGGKIWVESQGENLGTTFSFTLKPA